LLARKHKLLFIFIQLLFLTAATITLRGYRLVSYCHPN